ncbi:RNA ligase-domain-containing protein [Chaetomidium leptoderma]|uniref:tRNA ligase n=1 Tax=Chaetomidium leptoderma TaxID=669021 RepID=A0AAN6VPN9_9PEZI|nr:RNA ligase-domain-containing protein [Chaetomidium leptoderma]
MEDPVETHETSLSSRYKASTDYAKDAAGMTVPYVKQDAQHTATVVRSLDDSTKRGKGRGGFSAKKTKYAVDSSPTKITVDSWRFQESDFKRWDLPTYARGLFTTRTQHNVPEIAIRGYDKFFNINEVRETAWEHIQERTKGPYELSLKENGCIIFISGLEDDTLLVCSKHSTGDRSDVALSHAKVGEKHIERQLERLGKTKQDLARELRKRNATAVAELCDDSFEEHILAYGPEASGLYLHGININIPEFMTYPSQIVQKFAEDWGFIKTGLILIDDINDVKAFLEEVAETGAHDGRDVEGFVIRCKKTTNPGVAPYQDWFFKYKFEEPYLMFRQWREATKALIGGKQFKIRKHNKITEEYLLYVRKRLASDRALGKAYMLNHGIIKLRNDFLEYKNMKGSDAANLEHFGDSTSAVTGDIILVPIATLGCGKTTIGLALTSLFGWGHIQNDNITGPRRPPRFTKALLDQLDEHPAVFADRNNAMKQERRQLITDVKVQHTTARLVALNFVHNDIEKVRQVTRERVLARGDNHQTIQAATDMNKVVGIMENFIHRFEPCAPNTEPDAGFDAVIDLDPAVGSRENLEIVIKELHREYPSFVKEMPSAEDMDAAIQAAFEGYSPNLRHTIPDRSKYDSQGGKKNNKQQQQQQQQAAGKPQKKKPLEYMSVDVPTKDVLTALEKTFAPVPTDQSRFFKQLQGTRRVQPKFHVTLMHRASAKEHPDLWQRYLQLHERDGAIHPDGKLGDLQVQLERVVYDDRLMAVVVRLVPDATAGGGGPESENAAATAAGSSNNNNNAALPARPEWGCVNRVAHITIGTRDDGVKPKESNDLLARWLEQGSGEGTGVGELLVEGKPLVKGVVRGVLSR